MTDLSQLIFQFQNDSFCRFFSDSFDTFQLPRIALAIALIISSGFMEDSIILAVAAPTPETLIRLMKTFFSLPLKNHKEYGHLPLHDNR